MPTIMEAKNLKLIYQSKVVLYGLNLKLEQGCFVTLMSSLESVKNALSYLFLGLLEYEGSIKILGHTMNKENAHWHQIKVVFENSTNEFIGKTVEEELLLSLGADTIEAKKQVLMLSKKMGIKHLLERNPKVLSCGEKQIVAIASALISNPKLLVLDNALCMIDNYCKVNIFKVLKQYQKSGLTIINMTCDSEDLLLGTDVILIDDTQVILNADVKKALTCEKEFIKSKVKMPFMAELCTKLKYYNVISKIELDAVRLVKTIWK